MEAEAAQKELKRLKVEGFFEQEGYSTDRLMAAVATGRFRQVAAASTLVCAHLSDRLELFSQTSACMPLSSHTSRLTEGCIWPAAH